MNSTILTKRELFDEDVMKPLLTDPRFNMKDRERLSHYNKHRINGGSVITSYRYAAGCE